MYSVAELEPARAGLFCWSRWKGAGRWQSCGNSYNFSQIITIVHKLKEQIGTLLEKYNYLLLFFKTEFFSLNLCSKFVSRSRSPDLEPGQSWTGFTILLLSKNMLLVLSLKGINWTWSAATGLERTAGSTVSLVDMFAVVLRGNLKN